MTREQFIGRACALPSMKHLALSEREARGYATVMADLLEKHGKAPWVAQ